MIKTIPMWKMLMVSKGKIMGLAVLAFLPVFIVAGAWMFLEGLQTGQKRQAAIGLASLVSFGACTLAFAPPRKYIPGKTFLAYRNKKLVIQKAINYGYAAVVSVFLLLAVVSPSDAVGLTIMALVVCSSLYVLSKSLKFHADVDFSTNEYLANALGFSVGEKVLLSYQNFNTNDVEQGSNAFAATATKLIVASFDGVAWTKLSRDLSLISHIGIIGSEDQDYFVKLQFGDGGHVLLCISLFEKITSNPILVIRRLLEAIDASILGSTEATQILHRRRVVLSSEAPLPTPEAFAPEAAPAPSAPIRNIELSPELLVAIRGAEEVAPGRRLEI
ncbi:hypothetical protein N5J43_17860 [Pseudomonas nicosulfuronedens]|uniref:hypothetical protein n=1 Tax=Pseudomonas nicosulfuronedens TaxID=2571105 RepID=UPI0024496961|nr:hypothetical protein [Pseudomonas nicosulfuronedens]MDH1008614.1 hypothetical protein [Pseudomonas nicosulfuronedens]MDH1980823.1 hypothetical protein [Pseudomonas nicosulfuronedens]MDH2028847.1 hypothetical protein [Pseudomonas nicosulfuronedens]